MAVFEFFDNLYDIRLKPRLLKSLIKDRLPDEKHPLTALHELTEVVSSIKTHSLLSESFPESVDRKIIESWKLSVDAWVEHVLLLLSSNMPDKCWMGICLLGVTCQECSSERFLASYSAWFQKLCAEVQSQSDSHFVKVASCASLSDLFTRLGGFSSVKKDGTSLAGKLIQPILKLLTEEVSEAVWEGAVDLLSTLLTFFPLSVHRHHDNAEVVIVSKILSGKYSSSMSKKFARILALLPRARGDEECWSLLMQRILISINMHLNDAFLGLEEEKKRTEVTRLLVPPGRDPPPLLGGQSVSGETSAQATKWFDQWLMLRVSTLMQCCCIMLTSPYPVQVNVPVRPLLALIQRVLMVDGSLSQALRPFMTVLQQELICSELPVLHVCSLDLLIELINGVRSQLLPHAADVLRLLTEYFRRCALPSMRIKLYSIMRILLTSLGAGIALYAAEELITNAFTDLDFVSHGSSLVFSNSFSSRVMSVPLQQPNPRKRKLVSGSPAEQQNAVEVDVINDKQIYVQIAALQALEVLLTVGGSLRSDCWRSDVDCLLINVATKACNRGQSNIKSSFLSEELPSAQGDFQLAALRALLASLLSPTRVRPLYLSQGLELFRQGQKETGTKLAEFCAHALLTLEVLIHPRALPVSDLTSSNHGTFEAFNKNFPFSSSQNPNDRHLRDVPSADDFDPEDDLYDSWLGHGDEGGAQIGNEQNENAHEEPLMNKMVQDSIVPSTTNSPVDASAGELVPVEEAQGPTGSVDVKMQESRDENMVDLHRLEAPGSGESAGMSLGDQTSTYDATLLPNPVTANKMPPEEVSNSADNTDFRECSFATGGAFTAGKKKKLMISSSDDSASLDSLPDIVDADPDSD